MVVELTPATRWLWSVHGLGSIHHPPRPHRGRTVTHAECCYCDMTYDAATGPQLRSELAFLGWSEVIDAVHARPGGWSPAPHRSVFVCGHCITTWHRERRARQAEPDFRSHLEMAARENFEVAL